MRLFARSASDTSPSSSKRTARLVQSAVIETLESRQFLTGAVASLTLVNADTGKDLFTLNNNATVNLATIATKHLNVRANVSGQSQSVRFALDSKALVSTDNNIAYTL